MSENPRTDKRDDDKGAFYVQPTDRLDLLFALTKEQAKEQAKGRKYPKSLEQVDVLVMLALIGHRSNMTGQCDPAQPTIAAELGVSVSTVERSIKRLDRAGFLSVVHRSYAGGLKRSSQHVLRFHRGQPWVAKRGAEAVAGAGSVPSPTQGPSRHQRGDGGVIGDGAAPSSETGKLSEKNSVKEPGEENTSAGAGRDAGCLDDGAKPKSVDGLHANDNQQEAHPTGPAEAHVQERFNLFFEAFPNQLEKYRAEALTEFRKIALAGDTTSTQIMDGLRMYKKHLGDNPRYVTTPVRWLRERRWTQFEAMIKSERFKQRVWV
ncbi:helix-turn-helix domain-containing protein [Bradyrhizobium sp. 2TAF24]|uniref:helix-turn-helix domain-containing protein n=1 Tax=Bradyrhizobium sp. 2TAF24 TaxID=3233011 RepID=UPI003F8FB164